MINDVLHDIFSLWRELIYSIPNPGAVYGICDTPLPLDNPQKSKFPFQCLCQV